MRKLLLILMCLLLMGCQSNVYEKYDQEYAALSEVGESIVSTLDQTYLEMEILSEKIKSSKDIDFLLKSYLNVFPIENVYYADQDDQMYLQPYVELPEGYKPTERPWYQEANDDGRHFMTYYSGETLVSTIAIKADQGVLGCDYNTLEWLGVSEDNLLLFSDNDILLIDSYSSPDHDRFWNQDSDFSRQVKIKIEEGLDKNYYEDDRLVIMVRLENGWTLVKIIE